MQSPVGQTTMAIVRAAKHEAERHGLTYFDLVRALTYASVSINDSELHFEGAKAAGDPNAIEFWHQSKFFAPPS